MQFTFPFHYFYICKKKSAVYRCKVTDVYLLKFYPYNEQQAKKNIYKSSFWKIQKSVTL